MITRYLTKNPCYRQGRTIRVKGLMLHSVGVPQPDPMTFINAWDSPKYDRACVHGFIGKDETYITLPILETPGQAMRGWHGGGSSNNTHIGVEMCEPAGIKYTGGASFRVLDRENSVYFAKQTIRQAIVLFATLCKFHGLNPLGPGVIVSHREGHALGIASNHGDPEHLWNGLGMDYSMAQFRKDVAAAMNREEEEPVDTAKLISDMTNEQAYHLMQKAELHAKTLAEPAWSQQEGHWAKATASGIVDGTSPERPAKRDEMIAILGRLGLL